MIIDEGKDASRANLDLYPSFLQWFVRTYTVVTQITPNESGSSKVLYCWKYVYNNSKSSCTEADIWR